MSKGNGNVVSVKILPNDSTSSPQGKLADAEVLFEAGAGPLAGLRLIGFAIWERRDGGRNVTFPARVYSVNGERRSFALLRPTNGTRSGWTRELILGRAGLRSSVRAAKHHESSERPSEPTPTQSRGQPTQSSV